MSIEVIGATIGIIALSSGLTMAYIKQGFGHLEEKIEFAVQNDSSERSRIYFELKNIREELLKRYH